MSKTITELFWVSIKLIQLNNTDHSVSAIPVSLNLNIIMQFSSKYYCVKSNLCQES